MSRTQLFLSVSTKTTLVLLLASCVPFWGKAPALAEALSSSPSPVSLLTKTTIPNQSPIDVQRFLSTPANWPKIVASSVAVKVPAALQETSLTRNKSTTSVSKPFQVGDKVDEIFGLPPILPLSVQWTCAKCVLPSANKPGRLEFDSPNGLKGVASDCRMIFDISGASTPSTPSSVAVELVVEYQPVSILAILAIPILTLDNEFALKVLLPWVIAGNNNNNQSIQESASMSSTSDLDKFRQLMGTLYGVAGLAHLADCTIGSSELLTMAGAPEYAILPPGGQAYALLWCGMGPISFALSRIGRGGGLLADIGLILYGLVEIGGAALISNQYAASDSTTMDPFTNAVLVQVIVGVAWLYSSQKENQTSVQPPSK